MIVETEAPTYTAQIYIAGDRSEAERLCRIFCDRVGMCVTVESVAYVFTGGEVSGVRVGFINYPRFPSTPEAIFSVACDLARFLLAGLDRDSASIVATDKTLLMRR